jgi:uncharacterized protein YutE (UPF0331/DUF86 family)
MDNKIKIIRDFVPVVMPVFNHDNPKDTINYIIWNLYNRVCEATKSFVFLFDNKRFYDAFLTAGHALETCAILSYVKDNSNEIKQTENYHKYFARSAIGRLLAILEMDKNNLSTESAQNAYTVLLKILYPIGASIIKDGKNYEGIIKNLNTHGGTNEEKSKLLKDSFKRPDPEGYIKSFSKRLGNFDDGQFVLYYTKYCNYKHSNMLTPGALESDIDDEEICWFLDLILSVVMYLDKYKLESYKIE